MKTQQSLPLKQAEASPCTVHINGRCNYREEGEIRVVFANGIPLFHYAIADKASNQYPTPEITVMEKMHIIDREDLYICN